MKTAYDVMLQVKDLCLYDSSLTTRDGYILRGINLIEQQLYTMDYHWRCLESYTNLYTTETMTLDTAPSTPWAVGDTITGGSSEETCTIVEVLTTKKFYIKDRSGTYTDGETLSNGTYTADQGTGYPDIDSNAFLTVPSDVGILYDLTQTSDSPYAKLTYAPPPRFHRLIPQPTVYSEGKPTCYTWFGGRFWWYPIPDDTYTIQVFYYKRPTPLKNYVTGTATLSGVTLTGSSTYWSNNANTEVGMYFAYTADVLANLSYPWTKIGTVTDNDTIVLEKTYAGASSSSSYAISSPLTFSDEFVPYIVYSVTLLEAGRNREIQQMAPWLQGQITTQLAGLIAHQTSVPDYIDGQRDFSGEPFILGDDYAKFPFIKENL